MKLSRHGRLLAFGGCYSNLQATEALLARGRQLSIAPQNMICTGDIIAYGADAKATLRLVRDAGVVSLMGNCEASLSDRADDCGCGFAPGSTCDALAVQWYSHAAADIEDEDRQYMAGLPRDIEIELDGKTIRFVHGNLDRMNAFVFPSVSNLELDRQIQVAGTDGVVAGHSGIPFTRRLGGKFWHNAGSIGMPANDGTARGWFSILQVQDDEVIITSQPLDYDFAAAAKAMRRSRLPEGYAAALETGLWPSLDILPAADKYFTGIPLERQNVSEPPPSVALQRFETLWVNTGTLCNLACTKCFMDSTPTNDALSYFKHSDLEAILAARAEVTQVGFTGGEPFMNPDIIVMLQTALAAGCDVLVLTNAMRPLQRHSVALAALIAGHPGRVAIRVSLDHYDPVRHEALRGPASFAPTIAGLAFLQTAGAALSVASRTPWGETEAMMRAGFSRLFAAHGLALDAQNPADLILFPEMDTQTPSLPVTAAALAQLPEDKPLMCRTSRMAVLRKGANRPEFTPCTLLPDVTLDDPAAPVTLNHPHCGQFCIHGGASCAGAPG